MSNHIAFKVTDHCVDQPTGGILGSHELRARAADMVTPVSYACINPASIDVHLGSQVRVYDAVVSVGWRLPWAVNGWQVRPRRSILGTIADWILGRPLAVLDAATPNPRTTAITVRHGEPFLLRPGVGYLMHTYETITPGEYVVVVDGKSSVGRLFCKVHETAGYVDPGFSGTVTLEVTVEHPTIIYGGMRIGQIRAHTIAGGAKSYADCGHYTGKSAEGAVPSHAWKQLREDGIVNDEEWMLDG